MSNDEVRRQQLPDADEAWIRETDEPDLRRVEAFKPEDDEWRVVVAMAEFVREDPLEADMRRGIMLALRAVRGVTAVWEEDREQWVAEGDPKGSDLVRAAARVVDGLAERARPFADQ
jgi:hypothetical protein